MKLASPQGLIQIPRSHLLLAALLLMATVLANAHVYADAHEYSSCYTCNFTGDDNVADLPAGAEIYSVPAEQEFTISDAIFNLAPLQSPSSIRGPPKHSK
jgi:hypothetical protein